MKTKIITASLLIVFLSLTFALASNFVVVPSTLKFVEPSSELTFTLTPPAVNQNNSDYSYVISFPIINMENGQPIIFSASGNNVVQSGSNYNVNQITTFEVIKIKPINIDYNEINIGKTYSGSIIITNKIDSQDTITIPVSFTSSFCNSGEKGKDLEISDFEIKNSDGDDDEWSPLDEIEIQVEVSNNGDNRIKDVFVEIGLFNLQGKNIIDDMDDLKKEEIDLGNINDGDEDTATFNFKVPADFEDGDFRLVVKAFSDDLGENELCTSQSSDLNNNFYQTISGEREEDEEKHVIFHKIKVSPSPAQCGDKVQITGEVANIGDEDYQDQVKVTLFVKDLNVNLEEIVKEDFDVGDTELVDFEFDVPSNTQEKIYTLEFRTYYDYDEDDDDYDITSEDKFTETLRVEGNCGGITPGEEVKDVRISAELDQETPQAIAGKQVIINVRLENTGDTQTSYLLSLSGNSEWSNLVSIDPQIVTIAPGESREVNIVLNVNEEAEGNKEFTIKTSFDGSAKEQKVSLLITKEQQSGQQLGPVLEHIRNNWFIYLIILVNIILIIAIILVIRSMVSPPHSM